MNIPKNGFYKHYKHDPKVDFCNYCYEVVGVARHTEEQYFMVLYRPLYKNTWFFPATFQARPLEMFCENVFKGEKSIPRFEYIEDEELILKLLEIKKELYN